MHFRDDISTEAYLAAHMSQFARALVMPNLSPKPVLTGKQAEDYQKRLLARMSEHRNLTGFQLQPLMTIKITELTPASEIQVARDRGVLAGKLYPVGVTTNSEDGVYNLKNCYPVFKEMERLGMNLCVHAEEFGQFILDREHLYMPYMMQLASDFPKLKITLEHITDHRTIPFVQDCKNVAATITAHHLMLTLDDVIGEGLRPHNYCKPVAKRPEDRHWLRRAATSGHPRFFLGSDSAPHILAKKECECGAAGVFTAPILMPMMAHVFDHMGELGRLEDFTSLFGATWYGLPPNKGTITLWRKKLLIPQRYKTGHAFIGLPLAGTELDWSFGGRTP